jgi:hypothetical protein
MGRHDDTSKVSTESFLFRVEPTLSLLFSFLKHTHMYPSSYNQVPSQNLGMHSQALLTRRGVLHGEQISDLKYILRDLRNVTA